MLTREQELQFEALCAQFRRDLIEVLHEKQTGHPGGSLSVCEILATLVLERMKNIDVNDPQKRDRDRLVLCKGHAAPMLYRVLAEKGFFPVEEMHTLRDLNTRLQGHPQMLDTPGVDLTSGPLWDWGTVLPSQKRIAVGLGDGSSVPETDCRVRRQVAFLAMTRRNAQSNSASSVIAGGPSGTGGRFA